MSLSKLDQCIKLVNDSNNLSGPIHSKIVSKSIYCLRNKTKNHRTAYKMYMPLS